jgi:exopolyphosphatase/guanosine-5'-triphosphate,3'-diphosphate pyrophosphatase
MSKRERNAVHARVCDLLAPHLETLAQSQLRRCITSGGTVRALARLLTAMPESLIRWRGEMPVVRIKRRQFGRLTDLLVESTHDERLEMPGIKRNRADLLPTGALILLAMLEVCGIKELVACDWGLREGVVLEALGLASAAAR